MKKLILPFAIIIFLIVVALLIVNKPNTASVTEDFDEYDKSICWNKVGDGEEGLYWPNGCKGAKTSPDLGCTMLIVPLTDEELIEYEAWVENGKQESPDCSR